MSEKTPFRCTYEWDREVGRDDRNDPVFTRHICVRPMHHDGSHKAKTGHTSEKPDNKYG